VPDEKTKTPSDIVRLKAGTRPKLEQIARTQRWKLNETIDALADDFLARLGAPEQHQSAQAATSAA